MATNSKQREHLQHPIPPVFDERTEVLILGSFPSPKSREAGFFYGHPQNRMWRMLARLFDEPIPATVERRRDFLLRHHIGMWDVLASCSIAGASDASIADAVPNDLQAILKVAPIKAIMCAGSTAARLYARYCEQQTGMPCIPMPSTSPANAAMGLDDLLARWGELADLVTPAESPVLDVPDVVALEQAIAANGTSLAELMDRAGTWLAYRVHARAPKARIAVLAGNGNNGGDGWVAARELARWGHEVRLATARPADSIKAQPARDTAVAALDEFARLGVEVAVAPDDAAIESMLAEADVVIDALLGTGFAHDAVRAPFDSWIAAANRRHEQGAVVVSADCPSGLNAQTGSAADPCVQADETVTMIVSKPGLHCPSGSELSGIVRVAPLCDIFPYVKPARCDYGAALRNGCNG